MLFSKRPTLVVTGEELCGQYNMTIIRKKELSTLKKNLYEKFTISLSRKRFEWLHNKTCIGGAAIQIGAYLTN